MLEKKIKSMIPDQKHEYIKEFIIESIGKNIFEINYTGQVPFNGLDRYISDIVLILEMNLSVGYQSRFSLSRFLLL